MRIRALLFLTCTLLGACSSEDEPGDSTPTAVVPARPTMPPLAFVGASQCAQCHSEQYNLWLGSHHDLAMGIPSSETVVGNFSDAQHSYAGVTSTFFQKDNDYWVSTDNADGEIESFPIAYTFGIEPLQQYLIRFPGGRLQALNLVWDNRAATLGGQRWTHLYPDESVDHTDPLHWTGANQNWNFMCSECHSTNLQKGYQPSADTFDTTWSEIDVACEACHGPGSRHTQWAEEGSESQAYRNKGLVASLTEPPYSWVMDSERGIAGRQPARTAPAQQPESCGRCHARRSQLTEDYRYNKPLADTHRPALLSSPLYFDDGQIREEVYVYGSFLQSAMYAAGVTCTDCHDAHSLELKAPGNQMCGTCHAPATYDVPTHHQHSDATVQCVDCHMGARTYMAVDSRRDHSFRVPRPDLSVALDTPNACNSCHDDKPAQWTAEAVRTWFPEGAWSNPHFASAFAAARANLPDALRRLELVASDSGQPAIVRATALSEMGPILRPGFEETIHAGTRDASPLVRLGAIDAMSRIPPESALAMAAPLLQDPTLAVRVAAAQVLAPASARMDTPTRRAFETAAKDFVRAQRTTAERPESNINLGNFYATLGQADRAERAFEQALSSAPDAVPAIVNLADLYRQTNQEAKAERLLRESVQRLGDNAALAHTLGLLLARAQKLDEALDWLRTAAESDPENARYGYVYAIALNSSGQASAAHNALESLHQRFPSNLDVIWALATMNRDAGKHDEALRWLELLLDLDPGNQNALRLQRELSSG